MKHIALLGSTGSIGANTLNVIEHLTDRVEIIVLAAGSNWQLLAEQAKRHRPKHVVIGNPDHLPALQAALKDTGISVAGGKEAVADAVALTEVDFVVNAVVGASGLPVSMAAVSSGKTLALANKESLVMAGELVTRVAAEKKVDIIPIDSEHSAIHQCLRSGAHSEVERLILTASGGPFRTFSAADLDRATPEMALRHPTWNMGAKVTIDSATLTNKALEILEAHWLFGIPADKVDVLVHPQSIIHSMVEFKDGSTVAQLGLPDMRVPIQYSITWPERLPGIVPRLDLAELKALTFEKPDVDRFPGLLLGWRAAKEGGTSGAVLNAANEIAVDLFLNREIDFRSVSRITRQVMDAHTVTHPSSIGDVLEADRWAREKARSVAF